jgi:dipeptidase
VTGTSAPCLSLFQPVSFAAFEEGDCAFQDEATAVEMALWQQFEAVHHRALIDRDFCRRLRASRDALEPLMFDSSIDIGQRAAKAAEWHHHWLGQARSSGPGYRWYSPYDRFWRSKRAAFG